MGVVRERVSVVLERPSPENQAGFPAHVHQATSVFPGGVPIAAVLQLVDLDQIAIRHEAEFGALEVLQGRMQPVRGFAAFIDEGVSVELVDDEPVRVLLAV